MKHSDLTAKIIKCAYKVHNSLGFGFLESVYQNALLFELQNAGMSAEKEKPIKVTYDGQIVGDYAADTGFLVSGFRLYNPIRKSIEYSATKNHQISWKILSYLS